MSKSKVSVIMAVYNQEQFVQEAIDSVLAQTYKHFEFVIVNDCSTDSTLQILKNNKDSRIKLINLKQNIGQSAALNVGIRNSKGKYIAIINGDDLYMKQKLAKQVAYLDSHPKMGAVFCNPQVVDERGDKYADYVFPEIFYKGNRTRHEWLNFLFTKVGGFCHPSVLIRRTVHERVGYYNELLSLLNDIDMWVRVLAYYDVYVLPEKMVKFRILDNDRNMSANTVENNMRNNWVLPHVLKYYIEQPIRGQLFKIFNDIAATKHIKDEPTLLFEMAQKLLKEGTPGHKAFAIELIYSLLQKKNVSKNMRERYNFSFKEFSQIIGTSAASGSQLGEIENLKQMLDSITSSKFFYMWQLYCTKRENMKERIIRYKTRIGNFFKISLHRLPIVNTLYRFD